MLSNSTLSSSPDEFGYRYWCSFCGKPSSKGKRFNAYRGILNGHGPQFGVRHIVKIFRDKRGSERLCDIEMAKTEKARQLNRLFALDCGFSGTISFVPLLKAHMDETPLLPCSADWKRPLFRDEWVLIEERTGKRFRTFVHEDGSNSNISRVNYTLSAFIHFSYHCTAGALVVCGFEGSFEDGCYRLKSPVIHSVSESFGETDRGLNGILDVFQTHRCNSICKAFLKPNFIYPRLNPCSVSADNYGYLTPDLYLSVYTSVSSRMRGREVPSAPPAEE